MNIIACVDKDWGIGREGRLLVSIPEDQKLFREETLSKTVIMGRKTLESLPGGQPLYGRRNIVLTSNEHFTCRNAEVVHSVAECLELLADTEDDFVYVIGGESIYREFLPYCNVAHITWLDYTYQADRHMPNLDTNPEWELVLESEEQTYFDIEYYFRMYRRIRKE